ncbi:MAG: hypothetical protein ACYCVZ_11130 [Streptosporangiaceae bacterium]
MAKISLGQYGRRLRRGSVSGSFSLLAEDRHGYASLTADRLSRMVAGAADA